MATLNDMVAEVSLKLAGYSMRPERLATTTLAATATSTTINVSGLPTETGIKGVIEIDDELIYVGSFAAFNATDTQYSSIVRGYLGTTAAAHAVSSTVTIMPSFPRAEIKRAINDTILAIFPKVWGKSSTTFSYTPAVNTYALPSTVNNVLAVSFKSVGSTKEWVPIRDWRVDPYADVSTFGTANTITLYSPVTPGATVRVTYSAGPEVLTSYFDDFSDTTGYEDSVKDVVVLGACYRLLSTVDAALTQYNSPENQIQASKLQPGSATNAAKYFYALFNQRLTEESEKLKSFNPVRVHFTR